MNVWTATAQQADKVLRRVLWRHSPVQSSYPDFVQTDRPRFSLDPVQFPVGPKIFAEQSALLLLEIVHKEIRDKKDMFYQGYIGSQAKN